MKALLYFHGVKAETSHYIPLRVVNALLIIESESRSTNQKLGYYGIVHFG